MKFVTKCGQFFEILSKSTLRLDKDQNLKIYPAAGVQELWLIDPTEKTITVFHFQKSFHQPADIHRRTDKFTSPIFPGLTFSAPEIFHGV